jgi:hypothetical protein
MFWRVNIFKYLFVDLFNVIHTSHHSNKKKKVYIADEEGQSKFDQIYDQIGALRNLSTNETLNAEYAKLPGTIFRIAGALHVLEKVTNKQTDQYQALRNELLCEFIGEEIFQKAYNLATYFMKQRYDYAY